MCGLFANLVKPFADIILYTSKLVQLTGIPSLSKKDVNVIFLGWAGPIFIVSYMFFSWILISVIRPNFGAVSPFFFKKDLNIFIVDFEESSFRRKL